MKKLRMDKIAQGLGAKRKGKVTATGGYFGAAELLEEIASRFRVPAGGGRATDPGWDTKRLIPIASGTLEYLEKLAREIYRSSRVRVEPMQLAALMLERSIKFVDVEDAEMKELVKSLAARNESLE